MMYLLRACMPAHIACAGCHGMLSPFVRHGSPAPARVQATTHPFEITYGTGSVAGTVAFESLTLGSGSGSGIVTVPHQGFGMVYDSSMDFLTASCDGLFVRLPPSRCRCPCAWIGAPGTRACCHARKSCMLSAMLSAMVMHVMHVCWHGLRCAWH